LLNKESILVANEVVKSRAEVLVQNLSKWGTSNTLVVNNETSRFSELPSFFDGIVIDAPCSGSGLFRKQPEAINEWSPEHVDACARRQLKILEDVLPGLKEGGILVYSTCSYSTAENEEVVQWLIDIQEMEYLTLPINPEWGIVETKLGYRFYPHLTQSEGFFCAVLRKRQDSGTWYSGKKKPGIDPLKAERALLLPYIGDTEDALMKVNSQLHLLNEEAAVFLKSFGKQFYFKKAGVVIGEMKGKDLVPNQELSWFSKPPAGIKKVNVDKETALKFLRKENFSLEEPLNGLVLICYKQQGLGWAKILPNRINNYFPNELRILK
jgi:NOL1/NOP2/fmu family ribosome biogenesis protein